MYKKSRLHLCIIITPTKHYNNSTIMWKPDLMPPCKWLTMFSTWSSLPIFYSMRTSKRELCWGQI